ncbi:MAG: hypothetical protein ACRCTZ_09280 [Sarcina sp.]
MHIRKVRNRNILKKIIVGVILSVTIFTSCTLIGQSRKISQLENDLYVKQQVVDRKDNFTETKLDEKTIAKEFNKLKEYEVFSDNINIKHKYTLDEEAFLGMHKKATLSATSDVYYQCMVKLSNAEILESESEIHIRLDDPFIKEDSIHRVKNTFHIIEDESESNFLCDKETTQKLSLYWEDSLDEISYEYIKEYYSEVDKENDNKDKTKVEIKELVKTITNTDKKITIEFR